MKDLVGKAPGDFHCFHPFPRHQGGTVQKDQPKSKCGCGSESEDGGIVCFLWEGRGMEGKGKNGPFSDSKT